MLEGRHLQMKRRNIGTSGEGPARNRKAMRKQTLCLGPVWPDVANKHVCQLGNTNPQGNDVIETTHGPDIHPYNAKSH